MSAVEAEKKLARKLKRALNGKKPGGTGAKGEYTRAQKRRGNQIKKIVALNPVTGIRGQGNYFTTAQSDGTSRVNKMLSGAAGGMASILGVPSLAASARSAGSWLSRVMGFGAYKVNKNTVCTDGFSNMSASGGANNIPEFGSTPSRGSIRVRHREFVKDILSSSGFELQNYLLHAGNPLLWPWLANLAKNFEEAQIHGCLFEFKPTSAYAVAGTQAMGNIIMATDYDVEDANYTNKREMEIVEFSSSAMSNVVQIHPIECDPKQNVLAKHYIQNGAILVSDFPGDPRFGCMGNFQIAASGMPTTGEAVGELWVTYDIELLKPQLPTNQLLGSPEFKMDGNVSNAGVVTENESVSHGFPIPNPFGYQFNNPGDRTQASLTLTCQVPASYIIVVHQRTATTTASNLGLPAGALFVAGTGITFDYKLSNSTGNFALAFDGDYLNADIGRLGVCTFTSTVVGALLTVALPYATTGVTNYDIIITTTNSGVYAPRRAVTSLDKQLKERDIKLEALLRRLTLLESKEEDLEEYNVSVSSTERVCLTEAQASSDAKLFQLGKLGCAITDQPALVKSSSRK